MTSTSPRNHNSNRDVLLTALAPAIWGSTYVVTTELLPAGYPFTVAMLRALPAGLLLLAIVRQLPQGVWWWRSLLLGFFNFTLFWAMLFISAYRLPGGVAATVGATQTIAVIFLARLWLGSPIRAATVAAALAGCVGVGMLLLQPGAQYDPLGLLAAFAGAASLAVGTVLSRRWQPPVSALTFTSWQLTAGGLLLLPLAFWIEPALPALSPRNWAGFLYLGLIGSAWTYLLWFRGLARLDSSVAASLGFFSPVVAVLLGWLLLGQSLTMLQLAGFAVVIASIKLVQHSQSRPR